MAIIPDIPLSDRRLGVEPPLRPLPSGDAAGPWRLAGRALGAGIEGAAGAASAYLAVKARREAEDADLAAAEFEEGWRALHNGHVEYGEDGSATRVKGLRDYAARDWGEGENALTALRDYEMRFRETDAYRRLGREGRARFDLRVRPARQRAMEQANALFDRDARARMADASAKIAACQEHRALDAALTEDDAAFDALALDAGARIAAEKCRPSIVDDAALSEERLDASRLAFADERAGEAGGPGSFRDLHARAARAEADRLRQARLSAILEAGLAGRIPPASAFAMAREWVDYLEDRDAETGRAGTPRVDAARANAMRAEVERAAARYAAGISARADEAGAVGELDAMSRISGELLDASASLPEGSRARASLAAGHARMEEACARRARYEVTAALDEALRAGTYDPDAPGEADPADFGFFPESRQGRAFAGARAAFDAAWRKERSREFARRRGANVLALRGEMLSCAARGRPQEFLDRLTAAVVRHEIAGSDFSRLSREFNDGWMRGFRDDPGALPKRVDVANRLLAVVKRTFGDDALAFTEAVETDGDGNVALGKDGRFAFSPEAEPGAVRYRRDVDPGPYAGAGHGNFLPPVTSLPERFTPGEFKQVMDTALQLALLDGAVVRQDPVTLAPVEDPKGHRVDAVADFAAWCDALRDRKSVLSAAKEIRRRAEWERLVREQGEAAGMARRDALARGAAPWAEAAAGGGEEERNRDGN